jgi:hypothetical protein
LFQHEKDREDRDKFQVSVTNQKDEHLETSASVSADSTQDFHPGGPLWDTTTGPNTP